jgi:PAT family beta-lactamase induction signal transducer AmpG
MSKNCLVEKSNPSITAYIMLIGIYFVQGLTSFTIYIVLSFYLGFMLGVDPVIVGVLGSVAVIPLIMKVFLAPLMDKYKIPFFRGKFRGYIIIGGILNAICISFLFLDPLNFFIVFLILWFLQSLGIAMVDVGTDAVSVTLKSEKMSPTRISSIMFIGAVAGSSVVVFFLQPFFMMAFMLGIILVGLISTTVIVLAVVFRERPPEAGAPQTVQLSGLKGEFRNKWVLVGLFLAFFVDFDGGLLEFTLEPYLGFQFGVSLSGIISISYAMILGGVISIPLGYFLIHKLGNRRIVALALVLLSVLHVVVEFAWGFLILLNRLTMGNFLLFFYASVFLSGLYAMAVGALYIDLSNPKLGVTMIMTFFGVLNTGKLVGILLAGALVMVLPMSTIFLLAGVSSLIRIAPLLLLGLFAPKQNTS